MSPLHGKFDTRHQLHTRVETLRADTTQTLPRVYTKRKHRLTFNWNCTSSGLAHTSLFLVKEEEMFDTLTSDFKAQH